MLTLLGFASLALPAAQSVLQPARTSSPSGEWSLFVDPSSKRGAGPSTASFERGGIDLGGYRTLPCRVCLLEAAPLVPPRDPPIRFRKNVPDAWLAIELIEGKNRQVRRMTAAVGHPTLRLIRARIGAFALGDLRPGEWRELSASERAAVFGDLPAQRS
jgi:16S rRNA U516 pseudouridylate synthase RsuA-like enzyme